MMLEDLIIAILKYFENDPKRLCGWRSVSHKWFVLCPHLVTSIDFIDDTLMTDSFIQKFPNLTQLDLNGCVQLFTNPTALNICCNDTITKLIIYVQILSFKNL